MVCKHLCCNGYYGQWRFELMRHIIDEIIFHLGYLLLPHHQINRYNKSKEKHHGKHHCRRNHLHYTIYICVHIREMNLHITHLSCRIIAEQRLAKDMVVPF